MSAAKAAAGAPSLPTLVTAAFGLSDGGGADRRELSAVLSIDCPMVVYADAAHEPLVRELRGGRPTRVHVLDPAAIERAALYAPVQRIRADPAWLAQADWLPESPQARLPAHAPLALSRPLWLYQQAQANPFSSTHFYWVDADLGRAAPDALPDAQSFARLARRHGRFLLLCRPHEPERELHGFDAAAMARLAEVDRIRWSADGSLYGGAAAAVIEVGGRYSRHLERTLGQGLMGSEASLLTLQSYADGDLFDLQFLQEGSVQPFFGQLAAGWPGAPAASGELLSALAETWVLSFNAPLQFECLLASFAAAEPALLRTGRRVLVNNSTDAAHFAEYDALCERYGFEQVREGNRGANGARMHAAELFDRGGRHAMFWFEDDMLLVPQAEAPLAGESGLPRHVPGVAGAALAVLQREFADYVKLSFTEAGSAHHTQHAWNLLEQQARDHYFPGEVDAPPEAVSAIQRLGPVSYAVGEAAYSNWPHVVTRRGSRKLFFEERTEPCHEQYWAARSFEMLRQGRLRAAVLLASPVEHRRTQDYPGGERIDWQRVEGRPLATPPAAAPAPARDWPLQAGAIFVAIANYRDSETPHTLRDLYARAAHPERVFAGVFSQVVPGTDDDCLPGHSPDGVGHGAPQGHVRELRAHASESMGACWARSRVFELLQGEEFVLQIDSHSRFETGWDERLREMLASCPSSRALLTTYPPSYTLPDTRHESMSSRIAANYFDDKGIMVGVARVFDPLRLPRAPVPGAFVSAGLLFGPASAFREVPYDPYLYFHGEEPTLALRFWTHGWDLFAPHKVVLYHDYSADRGRPRNWDDRHDWTTLDNRSVARLRHLFGIEESRDPAVLREIERYGLGTARTLAEYAEFADMDYAGLRIGPRAADGHFPAPVPPASLAMLRAARARYREGLTGERDVPARETRSGDAATIIATVSLRPALGEWLREQGIRRLVDAGCGDFNWMRAVDLGRLELYLGYDIVPELIACNQRLYGHRRGHFFTVADIARTPIAACDAILCRRVLCDMSQEEALRAVEGFRKSGARHLLATLRVQRGGEGADFNDLLAPPFGLGDPVALFPDGSDTALAVWRLAAD